MGTTILALLGAFLLLLLSSLVKEYIPTACCLLALLFAASSVATLRRGIEKSKDECRGQRSINRACDERHKEAVDKLEQEKLDLEQEKLDLAAEKPCIRVHYEQRDAIAECMVKQLKYTNADLTRRVLRLLKRDVQWQENVADLRRDMGILRSKAGRCSDERIAWRTDAVNYKRYWQNGKTKV
jgi:hypothetical protein